MKILQITSNMRFFAPKMWPMLCFVSKNRNMSRHVGNLCVRMVLLLLPLHLYVAHNLSLSLSRCSRCWLRGRGCASLNLLAFKSLGKRKRVSKFLETRSNNTSEPTPPLRPPVSLHRVRHIHATSFQNKGFLPRRHISLSLSLSLYHTATLSTSLSSSVFPVTCSHT